MTKSTDLIVIGAGPGGYRAAELAAKAGLKVVIFESGEVGGTCLNVGCIPTKTYVHSATFMEARERQQTVVAQLRAGVEQILTHPNITLVRAKARFVNGNTVVGHASQRDDNGLVGHASQRDNNGLVAHASQRDNNSLVGHASQRDNNSLVGHASQRDNSGLVGHASQRDNSGLVAHASQRDDNGLVGHASQRDNSGLVGHASQRDDNGLVAHASQRDDNGLVAHASQRDNNGLVAHASQRDDKLQETIYCMEDDTEALHSYSAPDIIISTGSETKWLSINGIDSPRVVDSTGLLSLDTLPRKLCIIGAGVIGMEFASIFNRFGSEVTVIEFLKECLPALDSDIAKRLRKTLEKRGITFKMKTAVNDIADIDADCILIATGRKPHTEGLNLEAAGISTTPQGAIPVDDFYHVKPLTSNNAHIYAIGDVNGLQMLAHAAEAQAKAVVSHILETRNAQAISHCAFLTSPIPAAIFTNPEAACVGPSEDQLKANTIAYECRKAFHRANGKAMAMNETEGMLKLFSEPNAGRILGCHVFGAHSADLVQEVSALMCMGATVAQLRQMVHIHPTLNEILLAAAES